jgi:thiamine biosynthesis lipoprotein
MQLVRRGDAQAPSGDEVRAGWRAGVTGTAVGLDRMVHVEFVWGTAVTIEVAGTAGREDAALTAIAGCRAWFAAVDERFSTYRPLSEVTALRNGLLPADRMSAELAGVVRACAELRRRTWGAFDPWAVPGGFDPSGYVKGWAAGRAGELLARAGFADHMVNAGGDVTCRGDRRPGSGAGWAIGVVDPHDPRRITQVVAVHDASIATSGRYERGDHVHDPRRGGPARGADSASVLGPDAGMADALASAALVDGPAAIGWFATLGPAWSLQVVVRGERLAHGSAFA